MREKVKGEVWLVGAGPGDPELISVKGLRLLEKADCVVYDALADAALLSHCRRDCELVDVGKRAGNHAMPQEKINELLIECAGRYALTLRLKGGDPYVFGRGSEEGLALHAAGVTFGVVPGITSAIAAPASVGIPLTHRGISARFTVFTGHEMPGKETSDLDIPAIAAAKGTKVILMGMSRLRETLQALMVAGQSADTPAAAVQWATTSRQKWVQSTVGNLADAVEGSLGSPAAVVIGEVVQLADKLGQERKPLPLAGQRVVVTRTREQAGALSSRLKELGAEVMELPTIRIVPPSDRQDFAEAIVDSRHYDWLIFSSPNGVNKFFEAFFAVYEDIRELGGARIAAVGPATAAELRKYGLMVDVMPRKAVAEELIAEFDRKGDEFGGVANVTMLWIHSEKGRDIIYKELMKRQAIVDECIAYNTVPETADPTGAAARLKGEGADIITFTSSSTVQNFMALNIPIPQGCRVASIGPVTSATLREFGIEPDIESEKHNIDDLVAHIQRYMNQKR